MKVLYNMPAGKAGYWHDRKQKVLLNTKNEILSKFKHASIPFVSGMVFRHFPVIETSPP